MKKYSGALFGTLMFAVFASLFPMHGAKALTISPPTFDRSLNPGDTQLDIINVYNETSTPVTLYPEVANFTSKDDSASESGEPLLYSGDEDRDGTGLAKWMTFDKEPFTLQGGERINFTVSTNIPRGVLAQPGGHYGVILFGTAAPEEGGKLSLIQKAGVLFLVRVSGDVKEEASLSEFGFKKKVSWYRSRPIDMYIRFENSGNTHLRPTGNVFIKNWMGRQVAAPAVNDVFESVLPHSIRKFEFSWNGPSSEPTPGFFKQVAHEWRGFAMGRYSATLYLTYGTQGQILSTERMFWVWPWHLMIVMFFGLVVVGLILWLWSRSNEARVIRKYERRRAK